MRTGAGGWTAAALILGLAGCQALPSKPAESPATTATIPEVAPAAGPDHAPAPIAWSGAGDCLGQLRLLHAAAEQGRLDQSHEPPFAVVAAAPTASLQWIDALPVPVVADLPLEVYEDRHGAAAVAPCLLLVEPARDLRSTHRVVDFEEVASEYQSGVRSERNPDYDAAQTRVREAERESKGGPSVLRVGDPMLDLVGLVVGGVISAFGDLGDEDLDEALAALKETPRSRDRPVYRAYAFERSTVRAGKQAVIPIALQDLGRGRTWRTELRHREMRQFAVLEGLDPRDPDYEQQRAGAMSRREFEHWQREAPQLPLSAMVAALADADGTPAPAPAPELLVDATLKGAAGDGSEDAGTMLSARPGAAAAGPDATGSGAAATIAPAAGPAPALAADARLASIVRVRAGAREGGGFYVGPHLVVTLADLAGAASVLDVTTSGGAEVLGLVVLRDPGRNLALVHVHRAGPAAPFADPQALGTGRTAQVVELAADGRARVIPAALAPPPRVDAGIGAIGLELQAAGAQPAAGAPVFVGDAAIGVAVPSSGDTGGSVIGIAEVAELLESDALAVLR